MVFKKILKGALHVGTGGTTYLAEKGYKAIKKKLENVNTEKLAKKKTKSIRIKEKKIRISCQKKKTRTRIKEKKIRIRSKKKKTR